MIIRTAVIKDAEQIAKNNVLLAKESEELEISFDTSLAGVKEILTHSNKGFYLVVKENDTIIGELMITFEWSDWRNTNIWWIQSVFVKESHRGLGVFKKLVKEVKKMAVENNVENLRLYAHTDNKNAIGVYEHIGMVKKPYTIFGFS